MPVRWRSWRSLLRVLLSVVSFLHGRTDFLDLALAYALINFIGVLAVLQFFESRERSNTDEAQG